MKKRFILFGILCCSVAAQAALSLKEIRTASNDVLVTYFKSDIIKAHEANDPFGGPGQ